MMVKEGGGDTTTTLWLGSGAPEVWRGEGGRASGGNAPLSGKARPSLSRAAATGPPGGAAASRTYALALSLPSAPAVAMVTAGCVAALTKLTQWAARHGRGRPLHGRRRC